MFRRFLPLFLFFTTIAALAQDSTTVALSEGHDDKISLLDNLTILEDPKHQYTVKQLIANDKNFQFIPLSESDFNPGYAVSTYWLKFTLKYEISQPEELFIEIATPTLNVGNLYYPYKGHIVERKSGDAIPFSEKDVQNRRTLVKIDAEPGKTKTYFVKIRADGENFNLTMNMLTYQAIWDKDYEEQYFLGSFYGLVIFIVFIYFFFFLALKDYTFLYYVLYVAGIGLLNISLDGYVAQYVFPNHPDLVNRSSMMVGALASVFGILYVRSFLNMPKYLPGFNKVVLAFVGVNFVLIGMGFAPKPIFDITLPAISGLASLATLIIIGSIITAMIKGAPFSKFFALAYLCLTTGVFVFVGKNFGLFEVNFFTEQALKFGTSAEMIFLSLSMVDRFRKMQIEKQEEQERLLKELKATNEAMDQVNKTLETQKKEVLDQKDIIEEKNKDITESIRYSKRIQQAVLPSAPKLGRHFADSFIWNQPKDIVGGDFPWFSEKDGKIVVAAVDCTGHGVPGAFMSVIGNSFLNEIVNERTLTRPDVVLEVLRESIIRSLKQRSKETGEEQGMKDGMDVALIRYDEKSKTLSFAGAKNPLYLIRDGELKIFKGDRFPIGVDADGVLIPFENHDIKTRPGDCIYIFSDGFPDQFGGPKGKKFKYKQFQELLVSIHEKDMDMQKIILEKTLDEWKGNLEQVDDILVIGIRIN